MRQSVFDRVAAPLDYHKYFHLDTFVKSEIITAQLGKASGESGFRSFRKAWAISKFFACFDSGFMKSGVVQFMQAFKIWDHDLVSVFQSLWTLYIYLYRRSFLYFFSLLSVACSHTRAPRYFISSVQGSCSWTAYPCANYLKFEQRRCLTCNGACPSMGFDADRTKKRGKFYLKTTSKAPFCGKFSLKTTALLFFGQFTWPKGQIFHIFAFLFCDSLRRRSQVTERIFDRLKNSTGLLVYRGPFNIFALLKRNFEQLSVQGCVRLGNLDLDFKIRI